MVKETEIVTKFETLNIHGKHELKKFDHCAGWKGNKDMFFMADGSIVKKHTHCEDEIYESLQKCEMLVEFVPRYYGLGKIDDEYYIRLENLITNMSNVAYMDIKIGTRTFSESMAEPKGNLIVRRKAEYFIDIYEKEPSALSYEEMTAGMVSHFRHRYFINQFTSSASLGFRIEGYTKVTNGTKNQVHGSVLKPRTRNEDGCTAEFELFFKNRENLIRKVSKRLKRLEKALCSSDWFWKHEIVCSSLFVVLYESHVTVHMIDFGKTIFHEKEQIRHDIPWKMKNHEDGYLVGLRNLRKIIDGLKDKNKSKRIL